MKKILLLIIFSLILFSVQLSAQCTIQVVTSNITEETCVGSSDASATATAAGSGLINYLWSDGQTTATAINLTTGIYTVTATDDAGCTGTAIAEVLLNPEGVWLMFSFTPVTCNGGSDGTAHVSVMTGVAPYIYIWNDPAGTTNADPVNLAAGQYTVTVTDSNGCSNYGPVTITEPSAIVLNSSSTNETCFGSANGSASVSVSGGTPGYSFLWSDGQSSSTATNLTAGDYMVTVTDSLGCAVIESLTIDLVNPQIMITAASDSILCFGGSDGSIIVSTTGGTGSISYMWSNGETTGTISNLTAGTYTLIATDDIGCTATISEIVSEPSELIATVLGTNVTVNGGEDGSATVTPTGGTPDFTYSWNDGQTTATATNLTAGTYTVIVTDFNGCAVTTTVEIEEPPCPIITVTTSHSDETCVGSMDGAVAVSTNGGAGLMTFLWNTGDTTFIVNNLSIGTYSVTVTDENGCTAIGAETIELSPEGIWVDIMSTNTCINGNTGTAEAIVTTGVSPYTYAWSNGDTTANIIGLPAGIYTVSVTDSNGCIGVFTTDITISNVTPIVITIVSTVDPSGPGASDGAIDIEPSGGSGSNYTYIWSNGETTQDISGLVEGCYIVTVSDDGNIICETVDTICISQCELSLDVTTTNNDCTNNSIGTAVAIITSNCDSTTYTYSWTDSTGVIVGTTDTISDLVNGVYNVTVTDSNGLTATGSGLVTGGGGITSTAIGTNNLCNGDSTGTATATGIGGTTYTYIWSNMDTTQMITSLTAGTYTVTVTDIITQCTSLSQVTIVETPVIMITVTTSSPTNSGEDDGSISISVTGGTPGYTYLWNTGDTTQSIMDLPVGCYSVTVTDILGCVATADTCISVPPPLCSLQVSSTTESCNPGNDGTVIASVVGIGCPALEPITFIWEDANGVNVGNTAMVIGLSAGTYFVTATDANLDTQTASIEVDYTNGVDAFVVASNLSCNSDSDGTASASGIGGVLFSNGDYMYLWNTTATTAVISNLVAGTYTVTVTDATMCTDVQSITITQEDPIEVEEVITALNCFGDTDAIISISASGGVSPYTYLWSTSSTNDTITGLSAGTYTVTVTDATMCTGLKTISIVEEDPIEVEEVITALDCVGDTNAMISVSASGGVLPYTYLWSTSSTNDTITGLSAGTYTVTVTDATMCTGLKTITLVVEDLIEVEEVITALNCFGDTNAMISVSASGGVLPYTYLWSTSSTNDTITGLSAGTYTVTVTDSGGCEKIEDYLIDQPQEITITVNPDTANICENFLTLNATAPVGATITWWNQDSVQVGMGSPFEYLSIPSGASIVYAIANLNGCIAIDSMVIIQNAIDIVVTPDTLICLGDEPQLLATNNNPSQDVDYVWTPTNLFVTGTDSSATPTLVATDTGTFEVFLYSINEFNCEQFDTITISVQDTTSNFIIKQQCIGLEVNYMSTSGTEMIWNFGDGSDQDTAISTTHTYLSEGDYTVLMILPPGTNNAACLLDTVILLVSVANDPIFDTGFTLQYDTCIENSTTVIFTDTSTNIFGQIDSTWWVWQGDTISTNPQDSIIITQSVMDSLTLYVMTEEGCIDSLSKQIEINIINVMIADTIIACIGVDTSLNPNGNPNYEYTWSPAPNGDPNEFNPMITPTVSTSYSVTITDLSGTNPCSIIKDVFVFVPEQLNVVVTADPDSILCEDGLVTLEASSTLASSFNWYNEYPLGSIVANSPTFIVDVDVPQYFYVEAIDDQYECPTVDSIFTGTAEIIIALIDKKVVCINDSLTVQAGAASNGEFLLFEWFDPNGVAIGMGASITFLPPDSGVYTLIVSNEYGCEGEKTFEVEIIDVLSNISATADPDTIILGETVQLNVDLVNDDDFYYYDWSPKGSILGDHQIKSPEAMPTETTEYFVVVQDSTSDIVCNATTSVLVTVLDICERPYVFFPNVFSPNGDGRNDILKVESVIVDEVYFVIYNRWGEKVFEGNSVESAWDGTHNGEAVSSDVYGYYLQVRCVNGKTYEEKGNVTVLR